MIVLQAGRAGGETSRGKMPHLKVQAIPDKASPGHAPRSSLRVSLLDHDAARMRQSCYQLALLSQLSAAGHFRGR